MNDYLAVLAGLLGLVSQSAIAEAVDVLQAVKRDKKPVWLAGNGGSASTAQHFTNDLFELGIRAHCMNDNVALTSMLANDYGWDMIFAKQRAVYVEPDDLLILFSTSGVSTNILWAVDKWVVGKSIGFTGFSGGLLGEVVKININVPSHNIRQVEDAHLAICHMIVDELEKLNDNQLAG